MIGLSVWADTVVRELEAAGFTVQRIDGLPFVLHGGDFWEIRTRLLTFTPSVPVERFFHHDGTLYVPVGAAALRKGTPV